MKKIQARFSEYIIKYSDKDKTNETASFIIINTYPLKDPNIWERYSDFSNFERDRVFIDFYAVIDKSRLDTLSKFIINNGEVGNGYTININLSNIYTTEDKEFRYEATISSTIGFTFTAVTMNYYLDLALRNLLDRINVSIGIDLYDLRKLSDRYVEKDPLKNIEIIPSLAPLHGFGVPNKVLSIANYLNSNSLEYINKLEELFKDSRFVQLITRTVILSYYPIPLPDALRLNRFSPGEYIGACVLIKDNIDLSHPDFVNVFPGIPTITLVCEEVEVSYHGSKGYIHPWNHA